LGGWLDWRLDIYYHPIKKKKGRKKGEFAVIGSVKL